MEEKCRCKSTPVSQARRGGVWQTGRQLSGSGVATRAHMWERGGGGGGGGHLGWDGRGVEGSEIWAGEAVKMACVRTVRVLRLGLSVCGAFVALL